MATQSDQLIVYLEGKLVQTLSLTTPVLRIGRTPENGLALPQQAISRSHAELRITPQGVTLTDLGSANGTYIGKERLLANQPQMLTDATSFRIGPYVMIYRTAKTEAQAAAQEEVQEQGKQKVQGQEEESHTAREMPDAVLEFAAMPLPAPVPATPSSVTLSPALKPAKSVRRPPDVDDGLYRRYLPDIFQDDDFLRRFLHIFEDIWEPLEHRQDHIEMYFDPRTCPASFLPWLASWLDVPFNPHWPEARHRRLLSQAMELYTWRGTRYGLARMIEVCTGLTPTITESPTQPFVFHIRITLPPGMSGQEVDRNLIEELIQTHKPAHAGYILEVNI